MSATVQKEYGQGGYEQETDAWDTIQRSVCYASWLYNLYIKDILW